MPGWEKAKGKCAAPGDEPMDFFGTGVGFQVEAAAAQKRFTGVRLQSKADAFATGQLEPRNSLGCLITAAG
jgi:hypothetical protein